jgi:predicted transcriptional regulator
MAHRTTFSLDTETVDALRRLAELWNTSQAGVIRRAVRAAAAESEGRLTPQQAIASFRAGAVPMDDDQLLAFAAEGRAARFEADERRP